MLTKKVTYEDFNGDEVTDTLYFNLSMTELLEMEAGADGGMQQRLERIIEEQDIRKIIEEFKTILLASYGQRSENGKRFIKNEALREEFQQTAAFDALFMQMAEDPAGAAQFVQAILPKKLVDQAQAQAKDGIPKGVSAPEGATPYTPTAVVDTPPVD